MNEAKFTHHASTRCAQRGIEPKTVKLILDHGRADYDHRGACRYFLGKSEKKTLATRFPELNKKMGRKLDTVVVVASKGVPVIITTFVRNRRN